MDLHESLVNGDLSVLQDSLRSAERQQDVWRIMEAVMLAATGGGEGDILLGAAEMCMSTMKSIRDRSTRSDVWPSAAPDKIPADTAAAMKSAHAAIDCLRDPNAARWLGERRLHGRLERSVRKIIKKELKAIVQQAALAKVIEAGVSQIGSTLDVIAAEDLHQIKSDLKEEGCW